MSDTPHRPFWITFAIVQGAGEVCSWLWPHVLSWMGPCLWVASVVLLIPGNFLSTWLIQKLLWSGPISLVHMGLIQAATEVLINAVVWLIIARAWNVPKRRSYARTGKRMDA